MSDNAKEWSIVAKLWFGLLMLIGIIFTVMCTKEIIDVLSLPSDYVNKGSQSKMLGDSWILGLIYFWDWCLFSLFFKRSRLALILFLLLNVGIGWSFSEIEFSCIYFGGAILSAILAWSKTSKS